MGPQIAGPDAIGRHQLQGRGAIMVQRVSVQCDNLGGSPEALAYTRSRKIAGERRKRATEPSKPGTVVMTWTLRDLSIVQGMTFRVPDLVRLESPMEALGSEIGFGCLDAF